MSEQKYPFWLEIYKGEGRYAVEPILLNYWGMYINSGEYRILDENADAITIASAVEEMRKFIQKSPCPKIQVREAIQPEHISKYHDKWIKFLHNNLLTSIMYDVDKISLFFRKNAAVAVEEEADTADKLNT